MGRPTPPAEAMIDWTAARRFLARAIRLHLEPGSADAEDLVQESLVRLLRTSRREEIRNPEALMSDIARKTAIDFLRSRSRWRAMVQRIDAAPAEDPEPLCGTLEDPVARTRFVVLAWFERHSPGCHQLALHYFQGRGGWPEVAVSSGISPDAVRRRWSRCVEALRKQVKGDPDFLWKWAQSPEGDPMRECSR